MRRKFRSTKKQKKLPIFLTKEVQRIQDIAQDDLVLASGEHNSFLALRNLTILKFLASTGIRVGELCRLEIEDLFLEEKKFIVNTLKGGGPEVQPLTNEDTIKVLREYLQAREKMRDKGPAVFVGWLGNRITSREIQRFVTDYRVRGNIAKKITPHTYRHTYAAAILKVSNIKVCQTALRHRDISSTLIYLHCVKDDVAAAQVLAGV